MTLALAEQESCFEMDRRRGPTTATAPGSRGPVSGRILSRFDKKGYEILQVPTGQEVLNAGADDYLVRPFSPLELLDKIGGFLDNEFNE